MLVCPGVRPTWAAAKDQARSLTPAQAIAAGADYLVIGRPITESDNPELAWKKFVRSWQQSHEVRSQIEKLWLLASLL